MTSLVIRPVRPADRPRWQALFDGYIRFYEREPRDEITDHLWARLFDETSPVYAIVAEHETDGVIGLANYVVHDSTSALTPVCLMQDLYVDPDARAAGVGAALIDWLRAETVERGWSSLYWHTRETNYRARGL